MKTSAFPKEEDRVIDLQEALLNEIVNRFPKRSEAAKQLMDILTLNRDGVYRRLRGDTLLSAPEIQLLATHYDISIDALIATGKHKKISFSYSQFHQPVTSFMDHLQQVYYSINQYRQEANYYIRYSSKEIPFFVYMMFPKILAFKLYVFGRTTWSLQYLEDVAFSFDLLTPQEIDLASEICKIYCLINSNDVWTVSLLDQTLHQLEYMALEGRFNCGGDALEICQEIIQMISHTRVMAQAGKKFGLGLLPSENAGNFELFHNEITGSNNIILVSTDQRTGLYHTFDTPNFIYTSDQDVCSLIDAWFDRTVSNSISISVHSSKSRNSYFNELQTKVENTISKLKIIYA